MIVLVFFYTIYSLIIPAITLDEAQQVPKCSLNIHEHTDECRDEDGVLICGYSDFVVHTHSKEFCYNDSGQIICELPEIEEHKHTDDCYEEKQISVCKDEGHIHVDECYQTQEMLTCGKIEAVLHTHDESCYNETETLICGNIEVTEHIHSGECFQKAEETSTTTDTATTATGSTDTSMTGTGSTDTAMTETTATTATTDTTPAMELMENSIMLAAETADNETWGYSPDDSIWWKSTSLTGISSDDIKIEENTPYIIAGSGRNNVLTNTVQGTTQMKTEQPNGKFSVYKNYEIWYFEKNGESTNEYRIRDESNNYLKLNATSLSLTNLEEATVFTLEKATVEGLSHCITIKSDGYYLNTYGSDNGCSCWAGYNVADSGSCMQILKVVEGERHTAKKVDTVSSPNTVINLFDYWVADNQNDRDNYNLQDNYAFRLNTGINANHEFKFSRGDDDKENIMNRWTGFGQLPRQGIVEKKLGTDHYPALSGFHQVPNTENEDLGDGSKESLKYLFDPTVEHEGKASYRNVGGLLQINDQGYYYFNSAENAAEFKEKTNEKNEIINEFNVYSKPLKNKHFFPFNEVPKIMNMDRADEEINHYLGVTLTTRFVQHNGGYSDVNRSKQTTFEFSGDDDVWIFIDDVLVGDLGGIHDAANIKINFATGDVDISVKNSGNKTHTTLKECYEAAGVHDVEWVDKGEGKFIYNDNTVHTLKFYYLERGNYESNMMLKYNLIAIPRTAIHKVDQYGNPVKDAKFAVYAAQVINENETGDKKYQMLYEKNGTSVDLPESIHYDEECNILNENNEVIAKALYKGTTNENGEMVFKDEDNMPYSIAELEQMFGSNFILREIGIPNGYRVVNRDVHLKIAGQNQKILMCENTLESGSRAASSMQITATDTLHFESNKEPMEYCDSQGNPKGTLFAVVYKYIGTEDNATIEDINYTLNWIPVYGKDESGFRTVKGIEGNPNPTDIEKAIEAARQNYTNNYDNVIFEHSATGTMQLTLNELPGHISTYYHLLGKDEKAKARYTVAYYWTEAKQTEEQKNKGEFVAATKDNTYLVKSTANDDNSYRGFELVYGADINVPNLKNKVYVQKVDEANNRIDGATFAIYKVEQSDDGTINYCINDNYQPLPKDAKVSNNGDIKNAEGNVIVKPEAVDITKTLEDGIHTGTAEFENLDVGQYIIKEIDAPPGFKLNTADAMVLVTDDTIYANAGKADDGIAVGRGPGYVVYPLNQLASHGEIDNTLSWIYARLKISGVSNRFDEALDKNNAKYLLKDYSCKTTDVEEEAYTTHLMYEPEKDHEHRAFNFVANKDWYEKEDNKEYTNEELADLRRIFTTQGWAHYEIRQDYDYGKTAIKDGTKYTNSEGDDITNLFSRSTYIRFTDERKPALQIEKVDTTNPNKTLADAKFILYIQKPEKPMEKLYYNYDNDQQKIIWEKNEDNALIVETDANGISSDKFFGLSDGDYYLEEVKSPEGYCLLSEPLHIRLDENGFTLNPDTKEKKVFNNPVGNDPPTYTITVSNYPSFVLPATGGCGTAPYTITGITLMAVPLLYVCGKKLRSKKS